MKWYVYKVDRKVDPYMGVYVTPEGNHFTGLFATKAKAASWCKHQLEEMDNG